MKEVNQKEIPLPAETVSKLISLLRRAAANKSLGVYEKQTAREQADLLVEKYNAAQPKGAKVIFSQELICQILRFMLTLLSDEKTVKLVTGLLFGHTK